MLEVKTFYPENDLLKKYIAYYYFLKTGSPDFQSDYYVFPHTFQSLNLQKQGRFTINENMVVSEHDPANSYTVAVQGRIEKPFSVQLRGNLDQVTIVFKPLGLNPFIHSAVGEIAHKPLQLFTEWDTHKNYPGFLSSLFNTPDNQEQIKILESYLLSIHSPFSEQDILQQAVERLTDFREELPVDRIAAIVGVNNRTFNRLFQKHIGIAPVKFRKIARFRHSLMNKLFNDKFNKLAQIGYESNFYDQSYFIKIYNKLAGSNPSAFFNSVDKLADDNLIFQFVKK